MQFAKFFSSVYIFHFILFFSFCVSLNNIINFEIINLIFYVLAHITIIYLCFYYFNFLIYFILFIYGILFDISLFNNIGPHLITFIIFLFIVSLLRKYLFNLTSRTILILLIIIINLIFILEMYLGYLIFNYKINYFNFFKLLMITIIIIFPTIFLYSKIDRF